MMGIRETLVIYALLGTVMALTMYTAREHRREGVRPVLDFIAWAAFWPFFAPLALGRRYPGRAQQTPRVGEKESNSHVVHIKERLLDALRSLPGLDETMIQPQIARIETIVQSLGQAEDRLRQMEGLLASTEFDMRRVDEALNQLVGEGYGPDEPRITSLKARKKNIEHLKMMRTRTENELDRALVKLEEMTSQVLILRFLDQPEARLTSLLKEMSSSVEEISSVVSEMSPF